MHDNPISASSHHETNDKALLSGQLFAIPPAKHQPGLAPQKISAQKPASQLDYGVR